MWELEGKTIPMRQPDGSIQFRVARGVGQRTITARDEKGRIVESKIKWRHPGLPRRDFLGSSLREAWLDYKSRLTKPEVVDLFMRVSHEALQELRGT